MVLLEEISRYGRTQISWTNKKTESMGSIIITLEKSIAKHCSGSISNISSGVIINPTKIISSKDAEIIKNELPSLLFRTYMG